MFPYPYKWLIGSGFYFYIKNQFPSTDGYIYHRKEWYLLAPAALYGLLRSYWFSISVHENSFRITKVIVDSDFFRIHEFFYQIFTITLLVLCLKVIKSNQLVLAPIQKLKAVLKWLKRLTMVFLGIMIWDILMFALDLILHNWKESIIFSYPTFVMNSAFIYWIGYMGFTQPKLFFNSFTIKEGCVDPIELNALTEKLHHAIEIKKLYINPSLSLTEFAAVIDVTPKELSKYINEVQQMNFSEFLNYHRVERVKQLLSSPDAHKYTLVSLAEESGFSSKSSFNSIFKKSTGMTPSAYKKEFNSL